MYEYKRKWYFNKIYSFTIRSLYMNIKENDILIRCFLFKIEVHVWILTKMIFLLHILSLKSKNMYKYFRKWYFYKIFSLLNRRQCMNIKENDILIRLTHLQIEVYVLILKKIIF